MREEPWWVRCVQPLAGRYPFNKGIRPDALVARPDRGSSLRPAQSGIWGHVQEKFPFSNVNLWSARAYRSRAFGEVLQLHRMVVNPSMIALKPATKPGQAHVRLAQITLGLCF